MDKSAGSCKNDLNSGTKNLVPTGRNHDCLREQGDDDILLELQETDDEDTTLELLHLMADTASLLRRREIITRHARRAAEKRKLAETRAEADRLAKSRADQMINSVLHGVKTKLDRCAKTQTTTMEVKTKPIEGQTALTVQKQVDHTLAVVNAAEHMLQLAEQEPGITKNQHLASIT